MQLARAFGALEVYAVDLNPHKLALAAGYGAVPSTPQRRTSSPNCWRLTGGKGVDVSLELIGLADTMQQAVQVLAVCGRAVIVGIGGQPLRLDTYRHLLGPETEIIGSNDHQLQELPLLVEYARRGALDLSNVVSKTIPLAADAINRTLDELEAGGDAVRTVVLPYPAYPP